MGFEIGKTVAGYEIVEVLGTSKTGVAYKVRNIFAQRLEILKILPKGIQDDEEQTARFLREIKVHAQLLHPNIVTFYNARELEGQLVMTTEFVPGVTLADKLKNGPLDWREASQYACHALSALDYAHSHGIIHRGFSSSNLIITDEGVARLTGFGFAKSVSDPELTAAGVVLGALKYMAPEQVKGEAIDPRSDIYSLGIVFYEMLVGKVPFEAKGQFEIMMAQVSMPPKYVSDLNPEVPPEISDLVAQALAKSPEQRFQTARVFREAIERVTANQEVQVVVQQDLAAPIEIPQVAVASEAALEAPPLSSESILPDTWMLESALDLAESKLATMESAFAQPKVENPPISETAAPPVSAFAPPVSHVAESNAEPDFVAGPYIYKAVKPPQSAAPVFPAVDWWTHRHDSTTPSATGKAEETEAELRPVHASGEDVVSELLTLKPEPGDVPEPHTIESPTALPGPEPILTESNLEAEQSAVDTEPGLADWQVVHFQTPANDSAIPQPEFTLTPPEPESSAPIETPLAAAESIDVAASSAQRDLWSCWSSEPVEPKLESAQLDSLSAALEPVEPAEEQLKEADHSVTAISNHYPDLWREETFPSASESKPESSVSLMLASEKHEEPIEEPLCLWTSGPPDTWISEVAPVAKSEIPDLQYLAVSVEPPPVPVESRLVAEAPVPPPIQPEESSTVTTQPVEALSPPPIEAAATLPVSAPVPVVPVPKPVNPDLLTALFGDTLLSRVSLTLVICAITFFLGTVTLFAVLSVTKP